MFRIKVPATTANMGPGFDTLGLALNLYNEFEVERIEGGIETEGCGDFPVKENLIVKTMEQVLKDHDYKLEGVRIEGKNIGVPISRGLGSSATCIVAGIMIANALMGDPLSADDIIKIGTEMEGHPDNIVPAVIGGMTVSIYDQGDVTYSKVNVSSDLRFAVMIPDFMVSTHEARGVMPSHYSKEDVVVNISRVAMLVAAMNNGEVEKLRLATEDRVHQPYRKKLIPEIDEVFKAAKEMGSMAEMISGSGSTLLAVIHRDNHDFEQNMKDVLKNFKGSWDIKILEMDNIGGIIW